MVDTSQVTGYCGDITSELEYVEGPLGGQEVDVSYLYSKIPQPDGLSVAL